MCRPRHTAPHESLRLSPCPGPGSGVDAPKYFLAGLPAWGPAEEDAEVFLGAGFWGADGADDVGCQAVHPFGALRRCRRKNQSLHDVRP